MKANKALKRLVKIEELMSGLTERYSAKEPHIREALQDAKAAVARAKEAVSLQASSGTPKNPAKPKRKHSVAGRKPSQEAVPRRQARNRAGAAKADRAAKKAAPARKKSAVKKKAAKAPAARTAATRAPIKKAVKKTVAKTTAPAAVMAETEAAAPEPMLAPPALNDQPDPTYG